MSRAKLAGVVSIVIVASIALRSAPAEACTVTLSNGATYSTVGQALGAAALIDTLTIDGSSGVCFENVLVDNTHLRIIIKGVNGAVISGAANLPSLDLRAKGALVQFLTVTGGDRGIAVQRNANAIIDSVTVKGTGGAGIDVNSMAFAVITNSTIESNSGDGVRVHGLASARIGVNIFEDGAVAYESNLIFSNGGNGVSVFESSIAKIYSNTINSNGADGIKVSLSSSVTTGANSINSNAKSGIHLVGNSSAIIGETPDLTAALADETFTANGGYAIECDMGSTIPEGHLGTTPQLKGAAGQYGSDNTCPGGISQLATP